MGDDKSQNLYTDWKLKIQGIKIRGIENTGNLEYRLILLHYTYMRYGVGLMKLAEILTGNSGGEIANARASESLESHTYLYSLQCLAEIVSEATMIRLISNFVI